MKFENVTGSTVRLPERKTKDSAGYDFYLPKGVTINAGEIKLIPLGVKAYMQGSMVLKVYPRSSLALKKYLMIPNSVGIIDADYYNNPSNEGEIHLPLYNMGMNDINLEAGERVCQGIFEKYYIVDNEKEITNTRNGGWGSTGKGQEQEMPNEEINDLDGMIK